MWGRPGLSRKTRSLLNLAMLTALNREEEFKLHVRAAFRNGVTKEEIREVLLQAMIYCGVPAANSAFKQAREVFAQMEREGRRLIPHGVPRDGSRCRADRRARRQSENSADSVRISQDCCSGLALSAIGRLAPGRRTDHEDHATRIAPRRRRPAQLRFPQDQHR